MLLVVVRGLSSFTCIALYSRKEQDCTPAATPPLIVIPQMRTPYKCIGARIPHSSTHEALELRVLQGR